MNILDRILEAKRREIEDRKKRFPLSELRKRLGNGSPRRNFKKSLVGKGIQLIGEIKQKSPLRGILRGSFDPVDLGRTYQKCGAAALSVLTDEPFFGGKLSFLLEIRAAVQLPLLRKDFILDRYQVYESAAAGADAFLLIAALLPEKELRDLIREGEALGLSPLIEVHTEEELDKALQSGAEILGVNNRDLRTFQVDVQTSERLVSKIPKDKIAVSESGIHSHEEVRHLELLGFHAVLIGQAFMERPDMESAVHEVMGR